MFTGIVTELGTIAGVELSGDAGAESARFTVRGPMVTGDAGHGDSISVNGVCLTVVTVADGSFTADVMKETLDRSSLGALAVGDPVNLEAAVRVSDRLGGHIVAGHVDGTGTVLERRPTEQWTVVRVSLPAGLGRYVVEKGSITLDGVSLTVTALSPPGATDAWVEVSLIPTTLALTTLGSKGPGAPVNLEVDMMAKHIERLLASDAAGR